MKVIYGKSSLENQNLPETALTVGTFDGVHLGHVALLERLHEVSAEKGLKSAVVTFDPHPQMVLGRRGKTEILNTTDEKVERLKIFEIDYVVILEFNQQLSSLEPDCFIERILIESLKMKHFVVGYDHSFGRDRQGNYSLVESIAKKFGYSYEMVGPIHNGGGPIKSTRIRNELKIGDYRSACKMLGYKYFLTGGLIRGTGTGKKLGYPTININIPPGKLLPKVGVYAAWVEINKQKLAGMAYIGGRLTFGEETITVEVNLFDYDKEIPPTDVKLTLVEYTRAPEKFDSPEELIKALERDEKEIKKILNIQEE